ncbi:hypothetical protein POJ06DRAFT_264337 [Lipomyces tetrasporus]|uniref:Zn(2)-C6 fungal-type domain-containing protein n=1 Tax=Lipomyces tetrasporus TaxID=54092 RepID=A0AAD7QY00_9ASCO|nr:uncharacterized protein POJ06DRAFT_264337 [Lipomyces tetrasporus]KAJ8103512.1 hypothetical protein POJ06DRAFT_264337 [Lipomyces tetrasporus]
MSTLAITPRDHKVRIVSRRACLSCRERKIKCEGVQDCRNCRTLGVACIFVPSHRGGKRRRRAPSTDDRGDRDGSLEHLMSDQKDTSPLSRPSVPPVQTTPAIAPMTSLSSVPQVPPQSPPSPAVSRLPADKSLPGVLQSIQQTLASLQQQINDIRGQQQLRQDEWDYETTASSTSPRLSVPTAMQAVISSDSSGSANTNVSSTADTTLAEQQQQQHTPALPCRSLAQFRVDGADLQPFDLPTVPLIMFLIDVYYDCFHPQFAFMLPKSKFLYAINFETDAAMLQAMFAISCRLASVDAASGAGGVGTIHPYLMDPMYWVSRSEKWTAQITNPIMKLKTSLLLAFSAAYDGQKARARDLLAYASSIIEIHSLELIDTETDAHGRYIHARPSPGASGPVPTAHAHAALLPSELERESFRRTYYMVWEQRVITAAVWSIPQDVPPFRGIPHVPSCDATYSDGLRDWNGRYFMYDEFEETIFSGSTAQVCDKQRTALGVEKKRWRFNSACFRLAAVKLLADTVARMHDLQDAFVEETDRRVRMLLRKLDGYRTGPVRIHMTIFLTHQILYTTLLLVHRGRARDRLIFVVQPTPYDGLTTYCENPISRVRAAARTPTVLASFNALTHATFEIVDMVKALVECRGGREESASLKMGPLMGFSLSLCVPIIASNIVLDGVQLPSIKLILGDLAQNDSAVAIGTKTMTNVVKDEDEVNGDDDSAAGEELNRADLDFSIRCMKLLGRVWRGTRHEYEESVALVGRMEKVM